MRPNEISSTMISLGSLIRPLPTASICCSPPERVSAFCDRLEYRMGKVSYTRLRVSAILPLSDTTCAPSSRLSSTLIFENTRRPSGTWAMPSAVTSCARMPVMDLPMNSMEPAIGVISPDTARRMVLLPAPLEPTIATISPCPTWKSTPNTTATPS
ncbi:MAG: hypothetical protein BWY85_01502 [Firmicutes bacterium ADurb.Bin506]|nr:MAG: hypothetical protein BWY85_01502 [Firmicutes bacterium ADurb.Bin506]